MSRQSPLLHAVMHSACTLDINRWLNLDGYQPPTHVGTWLADTPVKLDVSPTPPVTHPRVPRQMNHNPICYEIFWGRTRPPKSHQAKTGQKFPLSRQAMVKRGHFQTKMAKIGQKLALWGGGQKKKSQNWHFSWQNWTKVAENGTVPGINKKKGKKMAKQRGFQKMVRLMAKWSKMALFKAIMIKISIFGQKMANNSKKWHFGRGKWQNLVKKMALFKAKMVKKGHFLGENDKKWSKMALFMATRFLWPQVPELVATRVKGD